MLTKTELELLLPHVNLSQYGQTLLDADCGVLTEYGLIERNNGEPILTMGQEQSQDQQNGMELM